MNIQTYQDNDFDLLPIVSDVEFDFELDTEKNKTQTNSVKLSTYQNKIINDFKYTKHNMFISALAGCAKTFTLVELTKYTNDYSVFLAFNKVIQQELENKITNPRFKTYTFNGLGYLIMMRNSNEKNPNLKITLDKFKTQNIVREVLSSNMIEFDKLSFDTKSTLIDEFSSLFDIGKAKFVDFNDKKEILNIIQSYNLFEKDNAQMPKNIFDYIKLIDMINMEQFDENGLISFGDQLYITLKKLFLKEWNVPPFLLFQNIFVDEAQDLNRCQQLLIKFIQRKNARIIAVGDKNQAIYAFNGSDTVSVQNMIKMFDMVEYELPINYRCPVSHLEYVNKMFSDIGIKACETAPVGSIELVPEELVCNLANAGDFILSRKNKDLCEIVLDLLSKGKPIYFKDEQFVKKILNKIKSFSSKTTSLDLLLEKLIQEKNKNEKKLEKKLHQMIEKGNVEETELDELTFSNDTTDLFDCVIILLTDYKNKNNVSKSIDAFYDYVKQMLNTTDNKNSIVCTSIHQAKGLEANNVFILHKAKPFYELAYGNAEQKIQERNLSYIALTRAKQKLYLVDSNKTVDYDNDDY